MPGDQALYDSGDFDQGAGAHALGILFEAVFPVAVASAIANGKNIKDFLDFAVADDPPQAYAAHILARDHHLEAARFNVQQVELFDGRAHRAAADLFDNTYAVIGIDDLVADVEIQVVAAHSSGTQDGERLLRGRRSR